MITEYLGPSIEDLFELCDREFSIKTICMIFHQLIQRIQEIHNKTFVHRDIKPDNFLFGYTQKSNQIYTIDFGLAVSYIDPNTTQHIKKVKRSSLTGTAKFASVNAHKVYDLSRRDDLESLGNLILYLWLGKLPWSQIEINEGSDRHRQVGALKEEFDYETLTLPIQMLKYIKYCK